MKRLETMFQHHQMKLWGLMAVVIALLALNAGAQRGTMPTNWEYRTVAFRVTFGDDMVRLQSTFAEMLQKEAQSGWDYAGRCAHVDGEDFWVDYVVFRRLKR